MASSTICKDYICLTHEISSVSIPANNKVTKTLAEWGMTIPSGYEVIQVTPAITGTASTDGIALVYGNGGTFDTLGIALRNTLPTAQTWTLKIFALCTKA